MELDKIVEVFGPWALGIFVSLVLWLIVMVVLRQTRKIPLSYEEYMEMTNTLMKEYNNNNLIVNDIMRKYEIKTK